MAIEGRGAIQLARKIKRSRDSSGFASDEFVWSQEIPCTYESATRSEINLSSVSGKTAELICKINHLNYDNQTYLRDVGTGQIFEIMRTFLKGKNIELTLTRSDGISEIENG